MAFRNLEEIKEAGFTGFLKIGDLMTNSKMLPDENGVYLLLNLDKRPGEFLKYGSGGYFKGKDPNVSLDELSANWVEDAIVVYIGKANSLKSRIRQYLSFGQGNNIGHYGGRYIWQLKYSKELVLCWKTLEIDSRILEADLIKEFISIYHCRPFANLKD